MTNEMPNQINIVYFSWVKERLGRDQELLELPEIVENVGQLIEHLQNCDPVYRDVFSDLRKLRFALDQGFVGLDASLRDAEELAIFPPVTGG
ncbi:molybdopterin converting factor subunit 1 [Sphingorhabdus sp. EL138]|jgi:molybdopterin synthase sulfur carrier subunit|uniref:molybdopterin converting factor subunit 1 n=1 Tax=Sphingorhabdus sp. EL138 TaxID=2073156 RepID=UPI0020B14CA5|nr:molybdopterin converting factor subunit 1 [Sphingorhabdus sp. EL138]